MALDILDDDDRVIDDQTNRQDHREQRQQIDRIAEGQHDARGTDQRQRNRDDRYRDRAQRNRETERSRP